MKTYTTTELAEILELNRLHAIGDPSGKLADLSGAYLNNANLSNAILSNANLSGAYLSNAILSGATLPDGTKWEQYLSETVPELLVAGGKTIAEIVAAGAWQCHDWTNCPMHAAFGINSAEEGPILLRPRITEFVQFYDAGLVPCPVVGEVE